MSLYALIIIAAAAQFLTALWGATVSWAQTDWPQRRRKLVIIVFAVLALVGMVSTIVHGIKSGAESAKANARLGGALEEISRLQERLLASTATIADLSKRSIDQITGGHSFCYLEIREWGGSKGVLQAIVLQQGATPLFNVDLRIVDLDTFNAMLNEEMFDIAKAERRYSLQFVRQGSFATPLFVTRPDASIQAKNYNIFIVARNGVFTQLIRLRRVSGNWKSASIVDASYYDRKQGIVFEQIDKGFPVESLRSDRDWTNREKLPRITVDN